MKWIGLEGPDGSGKTTLTRRLADDLIEQGHKVIVLPSPGGWSRGGSFRDVIFRQGNWKIEQDLKDREWHPLARRLLFVADFIQSVHENITPNLGKDVIILMDRINYVSNWVYGGAEGLDEELLHWFFKMMQPPVAPNVIFFLDVDVNVAESRLGLRDPSKNNVLDVASRQFKEHVRQRYMDWYVHRMYGDFVVRIDANRSEDEVYHDLSETTHSIILRP